MEIKFIYKGEDFDYLKNDVVSAYKEIGGYFKNAPKNITVRVHKTKKGFTLLPIFVDFFKQWRKMKKPFSRKTFIDLIYFLN